MIAALCLNKTVTNKRTISDRIMAVLQRMYQPFIRFSLQFKKTVILLVLALFAVSLWNFSQMGGEFIPTLEEGDFALHQILPLEVLWTGVLKYPGFCKKN